MSVKKRVSICFEHNDFEFYVSCDDTSGSLGKLTNTYSNRGLGTDKFDNVSVLVNGAPAVTEQGEELTQPFFFENRQYWFEIEFAKHVERGTASVSHKYRLIEQSFSLNRKGSILQAMLDFGNDVGNCEFQVHYVVEGQSRTISVQFMVFATKMVLAEDLKLMNQAIDSVYPFWRYAVSSKTTHSQGKSAKQPKTFELFWLAQFERLVSEFQLGCKFILNSPHNRLQPFTVDKRLDRINKRLSPRQQEKARELISAKRFSSRMAIKQKRLNVDTPENRFIKMVLKRTKAYLGLLLNGIDKTKVSKSFCDAILSWQQQVTKTAMHSLWQEVGEYEGLGIDSKVLQQRSGYAKVFSVWQQLKHYLNQANGDAELSIKSVADIYEIWCFIEVMSIVKDLGFVEKERSLSTLKQVQFEKQFVKDEMAAAFVFFRESDGMTIELAHEPTFNPKGQVNRTWLANQRPDIVLRVTLQNGESFLILFDAKYRIDTKQLKAGDAVPEDAINQMHRYRDAIIHQQELANELPLKTRPVMGAFALYPGFYDQSVCSNPYDDAIEQIGIGAFALLPSCGDKGNHSIWLKSYLARTLGYESTSSPQPSNDYYFVEDSTRIAPYGSASTRYHGLTMIAPLNEIGREDEYKRKARDGSLKGYHTQLLATNRQNVHRNVIREIRYLIITVRDNDSDINQVGKYLYRVNKVKLLPRKTIDKSLTGKSSDDDRLFWLFEFEDEPILLNQGVEKVYEEHFEFKLTKAGYLARLKHWDDVVGPLQLYSDLGSTW